MTTMTLSSVFEVGLGLILVYYVVSAIVTGITDQVNRIRNLSVNTLKDGLRDMLASKDSEFENAL